MTTNLQQMVRYRIQSSGQAQQDPSHQLGIERHVRRRDRRVKAARDLEALDEDLSRALGVTAVVGRLAGGHHLRVRRLAPRAVGVKARRAIHEQQRLACAVLA